MAAALQCEICGGKLVGKPGGVFECDSCGMEYSTEWANAKIQEIRGTVQVEGTVEVKGSVKVEGGTVQIEGAANKESLLKRGFMACEDGNWDEAVDFFDRALDADAGCAEAYVGFLMADLSIHERSALGALEKPFDGNANYRKAMRFADAALKAELEGYNRAAAETEARLAEEERKRREEEQERKRRRLAEMCRRSEETRKRIAPAQGVISAGGTHTVGLRSDGTVAATRFIKTPSIAG